MTAEQLSEGSERIVHGRVQRSWPAWDDKHKYIWTHYEIAVTEMLRGPHAATVTVSEPGGTLDGVSMQSSGALPFAAGESAVLFLFRTPIGYWRVLGGPQGKFTIDRQGLMRAGSADVVLVDPAGRPGAGTPLATLQGLPVSDFLARVRRLAAAHPYRRPQ